MQKINLNAISEYQLEQCKLFAKFSVESSLDEYGRRGQHNSAKITQDILNGKVAEFMVYNMLLGKGKTPSTPDLNIYKARRKSFDPDISIGDINIHVKSHVVNDLFPVSWLFQKNDPLIKNRGKNDFLFLVVIGDSSYVYATNINDVTFRQPMKESLRKTKVCIYERDFAQ